MRNILAIFRSDLRRLSRSFWAMVILAACMLLPAMYAWVNIYANWDPYGNTGGVKIAVVSNDQDYVSTEDGVVHNVGNDVIKSLKAKTSIGWQFMDDEVAALDGVYDGSYYAAIIIDKDFTYNMYNFLTTDMTQPTIRYYVNSKTNPIATKITDTAASTVKASVNENYLKVIIETLFKKVNGVYANIESEDPVSALEDVLVNVNNNIKSYSSALGAFTRAGNQLTNELASMRKTTDYAIYTINQSRDHISSRVGDLDSAKQELAAVNQEVDSSLSNISSLLQKAIDQLSGKDITATTTPAATMEQLEKQYNELITYLETRGGENDPATADVLSALNNSVAQMEALRKSLGLDSSFSDDKAYLNMLEQTDAMKQIQSDFNNVVVPGLYKEYVDSSADSVLQENTSSLATLQSMSYFMADDAAAKLDSIKADLSTASAATDPAVAAQAVDSARSDAADAAGELHTLGATYTQLGESVPGFDDAQLAAATDTAASQLTDLANSLPTAGSLALPTVDIRTLLEGNKLAVDVVRGTLTQDVYPALDSALSNMQSSLGDMSSVLMNTADALEGGKSVLSSLSNTVQTLNGAFYQLQNVLNNLSKQITDVLQKIDDLKNDEAVQTLLDFFGLDPDAIGSFLAQPVDTVTETVYPVANYGSGMTPFYSTLAIWVGSVILGAILRAEADATVLADPKMWQLFFGRYLTFFFFGQLQAVVIVLGDLFILGCQCLHPWLFLMAGSVTAFSFSLLIYALTVSFGDVGKAIAVVVMILQIAGSSGSFPIELLPEFFQKAYVFFPFPYAINAMRECIAGLYRLDLLKYCLDLMIFVAAGLFIGLVIRKPFVGLTKYIEDKMEDTELLK